MQTRLSNWVAACADSAAWLISPVALSLTENPSGTIDIQTSGCFLASQTRPSSREHLSPVLGQCVSFLTRLVLLHSYRVGGSSLASEAG